MIEVKAGYKQTEVGVIPEDWDIVELKEAIASTQLGGNYPNSEMESDFPLIKMGNIGRGKIDLSKIEYVPVKDIPKEKYLLHYGDVLFNTRNTLDLVGKVAIWKSELLRAYYNSNLMRMKFKDDCVSSNFYINYLFNSRQSLTQLKGFAIGTTSVAAIYNRDLFKYKLVLPKLEEQKSIATILSDTDALIEHLEELIAKKRNIKQGTMQQLITGKKRLPGFEIKKGYKQTEVGLIPVDWDVKNLNNMATITRLAGYEYSSMWEEKNNGKIIALRGFNIGDNRIIEKNFSRISNELSLKLKRSRLYKNDVIYPCVGTIGNAVVIEDDNKYHIQQNIAKITPNKNEVDSYYLAHYLMSHLGLNEITKFNGTSSQPNILVGSLRQYSIVLPPTKSEQTAIATILSDMDTEIEALKQNRDKYTMIKQGMMQQLLTGRIRIHGTN